MRCIYLVLFLLVSSGVFGQNLPQELKGEILNVDGIGIQNCTVKVSGLKSGLIYSYFSCGEKNTFTVKMNVEKTDSLVIEVSHISYMTLSRIHNPGDNNNRKISFILRPKANNLNPVEIEAPSTWVRGDTTYHKVDAFREGDEKKLKDLLLKLPNFSLSNEGKILYKQQTIEKITIDGEELFSDKVELMVNNFPVHILNTIQAIENQSSQKLLKGLTGERKIFLNLQLNNDAKLRAAFGDGELGIGNERRYNVAPVVFSMYGLLKLGFIGSWNSIGDGVGILEERELKNEDEIAGSKLLMSNFPLTLINNFENRWYIKNQQWDNRLQLNSRVSKAVKTNTEVAYVKDRQVQNTYFNSSIYHDNVYEDRIDSNFSLYKPRVFTLKQTFDILPDSTAEIKIVGSVFKDNSKGTRNSVYHGFGISNPLNEATDNDWTSLNLSAIYTKRRSATTAEKWFFAANQQFLKQYGTGASLDFAKILDAEAGYDNLNNNLHSRSLRVSAGWSTLYRNPGGRITNLGISLAYLKLHLENMTALNNSSAVSASYYPIFLNNLGNFSVKSATVNYTKAMKFVFREPFLFKADLGLSNTSVEEHNNLNNFTNMIIKTAVTHNHKFFDRFSGRANASFSQQPLEPDRLYGGYYPSSLTSFKQNKGVSTPLKKLHFDYNIGWEWPNDLSTSSIGIFSDIRLNNMLSSNSYNSFFLYTTHSIVNNGTRNISFYISSQVPSLLLNALINVDVSHSLTDGLLRYNNEVLTSDYSYFSANLSIKKNWNKRYFIKFNSLFSTFNTKVPVSLKGGISSKVSGLRTTFYQRLVLSKQLNIISNVSVFQNNLFTPNKADFLLADIECSYKLKNKPVFFTIRAENLTDEHNFFMFSNSTLSQSFSAIPLIRRNYYLSARYNF